MRILGIALVFLAGRVVAQEPAAPAVLEGIVVHGGTNDPLAAVSVELRTDAGVSTSVTTDDAGRFILPKVKPGHYRLFAARPGFVRAEYGQRTDTAPWHGVPIELNSIAEIQTWRQGRPVAKGLTIAAGEELKGLRIAMTPGGVITGRVTNKGKPLAAVMVSAVKVSYDPGGEAVVTKFLSGTTNDLGEYHIFWLPPGRYYVAADLSDTLRIPPPSMFVNPTDGAENPLLSRGAGQAEMSRNFLPGDSARVLFLRSGAISESEMGVPNFFPDKTSWSDATPVDIRAGEQVRNVDIRASSVPALHVRGTVPVQGQPTTRVELFQVGSNVNAAYANGQADPNGSFDLSRVQPGSYLLRATVGNTLLGRVSLDLRDRDANGVTIIGSEPTVTVSGRVVFEQPDMTVGNLNIGVRAESVDLSKAHIRRSPEPARPVTNGAFTMSVPVNLETENYRVYMNPILPPLGTSSIGRLPPVPENSYVKSIRMGAIDVLNDGLHLRDQSSVQQLVITIGANAGRLEGRTVRGQQPVAGTVVLIPEGPQRFRVPHKFGYSDESGRFQFTGVPPGDYKMYAWESVETFAWQNIKFMRAYESQGKLVRVEEGARITSIELQFIP